MEELLNDLRDRIRPMKKPTDLSNGDQPGASLVENLHTGSNFMNWSKAIKFALGAKSKLGFIDGKIPKTTTGDDEIELWIRTDCMVRCWIINFMKESIATSFMNWSKAIVVFDPGGDQRTVC